MLHMHCFNQIYFSNYNQNMEKRITRILIKNWKSFKDFFIVETCCFLFSKYLWLLKYLKAFFGVFLFVSIFLKFIFPIWWYYQVIHSLQYIWIQYLWNNFLQHEYFKFKKKSKSWSLKILLICTLENYVLFLKSCIFSKTVVRILKIWNWSYLNNLITLKEKIFVVFME